MKRSSLQRRSPLRYKRKRSIEEKYVKSRAIVFCRAGGRCEACAAPITLGSMHAHHRRPRSAGRDDSPCNLLGLCSSCHGWVHDHPLMAVGAGYSITRAGEAPSLAGVRFVHGWFLLTEAGDKIALPCGPTGPIVA